MNLTQDALLVIMGSTLDDEEGVIWSVKLIPAPPQVAGNDTSLGFLGVAPQAKLNVYRVYPCLVSIILWLKNTGSSVHAHSAIL